MSEGNKYLVRYKTCNDFGHEVIYAESMQSACDEVAMKYLGAHIISAYDVTEDKVYKYLIRAMFSYNKEPYERIDAITVEARSPIEALQKIILDNDCIEVFSLVKVW